jgi:DNA/RNA-binding domain of Phe-tRNA-synthetase-like protein
MPEIRIHPKIFEEHPSFRRGIVIARNMDNQGHSSELEDILNRTIAQAARQPILLKRVQKPGAAIPFINKVVAIMNINSIQDKTPVGGDDVVRANGSLELRYADGSESFTPLGSPDKIEHPVCGEVIYLVPESNEVMCRRWNWRNGHHTRIAEETRVIVMNIDSLGEESEGRAIATRDRVAQMLEAYCQAEVATTLLSLKEPSYPFNL